MCQVNSSVSMLEGLFFVMTSLGLVEEKDPHKVKGDTLESLIREHDERLLDMLEVVLDDAEEMALVSKFNDVSHEIWCQAYHLDEKAYRDALEIASTSKYANVYAREGAQKILSPNPGFVYFLACKEGYVKIGCATDIDRRLGAFNTLPPFNFELGHSISADDMYVAERKLHLAFADKRANGEWFTLSESDMTLIKSTSKYKNGTFYTPDGQEVRMSARAEDSGEEL